MIKVGSRDSRLAVVQAEEVCRALGDCELITMKTLGDMILDKTLDQVGGKGLFVKELDRALAEGRVDLTVHSLKDVPMEQPEGLPLVAHNSVFDEGCLKAAHEAFDLAYPAYRFHCTCRLSRRLYPDLPNHRLETVAEHCGCDLYMHHHALADAEACALIAVRMMREKGVQSLAELWVNAQKKQE